MVLVVFLSGVLVGALILNIYIMATEPVQIVMTRLVRAMTYKLRPLDDIVEEIEVAGYVDNEYLFVALANLQRKGMIERAEGSKPLYRLKENAWRLL